MNVITARWSEDGAIIARIGDDEWSGITPSHRFYEAVQEWVAAGNTITLYGI